MTKNQIKLFKSLQFKKYRQKHKKIVLEGKRLVSESIKCNVHIDLLWITNKAKEKIEKFLPLKNINYTIIDEKVLKKISDTKTSQGIIAIIDINKYFVFLSYLLSYWVSPMI